MNFDFSSSILDFLDYLYVTYSKHTYIKQSSESSDNSAELRINKIPEIKH